MINLSMQNAMELALCKSSEPVSEEEDKPEPVWRAGEFWWRPGASNTDS